MIIRLYILSTLEIRKLCICIDGIILLDGFPNSTIVQVHPSRSINRKLVVIPNEPDEQLD